MLGSVYELKTDNSFVGLTFVDEQNFVFPSETWLRALHQRGSCFQVMFDSTRIKPETVRVPDFARFSPGFCCFERSAWAKLNKELTLRGDTVELLLTECRRNIEFVLFEPREWFDCLDFDRSAAHYFDTPPYRVKWVDDVVLRNVSPVGEDIFRVEHLPTRLFCSEKCLRVVRKHKLTGFEFRRVPVSD